MTIGGASLLALGVFGLLTAAGCGSSGHPAGAGGAGGSAGGTAGVPAGGASGKGGSAAAGAGGGANPDAGAPDGGNPGGAFVSGSACTNAQTQFAFTALGDANPLFTTGVGVRAPSRLLAFTGSSAPPADGGTGGAVNTIDWQAFDVTSAKSLGPVKPLASFTDPNGSGPIHLEDASISPTGEIAILFSHIVPQPPGSPEAAGLSALFLSPETSNAGDAAPEVAGVVQLESDDVGTPPEVDASRPGQAHAIWSTQAHAFVFSWVHFPQGGGAYVKVAKYLPSGAGAGGNTDTVPTGPIDPGFVTGESGSVATTGALFGVAYMPYGVAEGSLTVLDGTGNAVTTGVAVAPNTSIGLSGNAGYYWVTAAGTATGIVYLEGSRPVSEYFVPVGSSGQIAGADAGTFAGFTTTGSVGAVIARALSDYSSGSGGVAAELLYPDGVSFMYVHSDGITHVGPSQAMSHAQVAGDQISITEFAGSFGVALYSAADHRMQISASGCIK